MWHRRKEKKKNNTKYSRHFVPQQRPRAAHTLRLDQNNTKYSEHFVPHALKHEQQILTKTTLLFHADVLVSCCEGRGWRVEGWVVFLGASSIFSMQHIYIEILIKIHFLYRLYQPEKEAGSSCRKGDKGHEASLRCPGRETPTTTLSQPPMRVRWKW